MARRATDPTSEGTYSFILVLRGLGELSNQAEQDFFEAGCDDALFGIRNGVPFLDFDREAGSFAEAVLSAIRDVARAGTGAEVTRVEPDDLVSASEIARRLGRSRESVRLLINGSRGPGGFPAPVSNLGGTSPIWSWADVAHWAEQSHLADKSGPSLCRQARFVALVNRALTPENQHTSAGALKGVVHVLRGLMKRPKRARIAECTSLIWAALSSGHAGAPDSPTGVRSATMD